MVLVTLDVAERGVVGATEHRGMTIGIRQPAIAADHGVAEPPGDGPHRPAFPSLHNRIGHPIIQQREVVLRLHGVAVGLLIICVLLQHRRRMGVGGGQEEFVDVKSRQPGGHVLTKSLLDPRPDDAQIAGDQNRLIDRSTEIARLQSQHVDRQLALDGVRGPHGREAGQRHGRLGRDVGRGDADPEFRLRRRRLGGQRCGGLQQRACRHGSHRAAEELATRMPDLLLQR